MTKCNDHSVATVWSTLEHSGILWSTLEHSEARWSTLKLGQQTNIVYVQLWMSEIHFFPRNFEACKVRATYTRCTEM